MASRDKVLLRAAQIIRERGWCQGEYAKPNKGDKLGEVAASHAIRLAVKEFGGSDYDVWEARYAVMALIGDKGVEAWNDHGKTTKEVVLLTMEEAAEAPKTWDNHMSWAWTSPPRYGKRTDREMPPGAFLQPALEGEARRTVEDRLSRQRLLLDNARRKLASIGGYPLIDTYLWLTPDELAFWRSRQRAYRDHEEEVRLLALYVAKDEALLDGGYAYFMMGVTDWREKHLAPIQTAAGRYALANAMTGKLSV
jgi:hypothetical protein